VILEGIVTTVDRDGNINIAPMGPDIGSGMERFLLRPFPSSQTYQNLRATGEGVFHVIDDVLLLAKAAVGAVEPQPALFPATAVRGWVLRDGCRYYEFRVQSMDDSEPRVRIEVAVVASGRLRDFFGFNRAKHAVVEAAILATRTSFLPPDEIEADYRRLGVLVQKTGGDQEREAFAFLQEHVARAVEIRRRESGAP
jgi:hypothetical protein